MGKWCCEWFHRMIDIYGQSGFSIVAKLDKECDYMKFYLVAAFLDRKYIELLGDGGVKIVFPENTGNSEKDLPIGMALDTRIPIDFCPRCGKDLNKLIKKNKKAFEQLSLR